jgi:aldose 1-epimerase
VRVLATLTARYVAPVSVDRAGTTIALRRGDQHALVGVHGARLRGYGVGARPVLDGCPADGPCTAARGDLLLPWPNRISGARYRFGGIEHRLPVNEQATGAAIHGLTRDLDWDVAGQGPDHVRLRLDLASSPGYPFALACEVEYALDDAGLLVRTAATNTGSGPAPYATGAHPYLTVGTALVDEAELHVPADRYYPTDEHGTPAAPCPVEGTPLDLRTPTLLGPRRIDNAYTGLHRDPDGCVRVRLRAPDGVTVTLWLAAGYDYVQVFTADTVPEPERRRRGVAVEPMTAAPDAFNTGDGLLVLAPGEEHAVEWGIQP